MSFKFQVSSSGFSGFLKRLIQTKSVRFSFILLLTANCLLLTAYAQSTGGVKGKVRTPDGDGITNATVTARQDGEDLKTVRTDKDGNFLLEGLKAGRYNLVFEADGYSGGVLYNIEIRKNQTGNLGDRLILKIDEGTQVIIRGSVFSPSGHSIYGAKVKVEQILESGKTRKVGSGYTSQSGEFIFRFPEGEAKFRVTVSAKGNEASKEVEVDSAAIYRLALTLNLDKK
jgi:hypothetical protein